MSEEAPKGRLFARRRRANVDGGRQHRHEVKVSPEEEGMLLRLAEAQHVTIPRLLVESALASATSETPTERRNAMAELFALHRLLAAVSNNVNQMYAMQNIDTSAKRQAYGPSMPDRLGIVLTRAPAPLSPLPPGRAPGRRPSARSPCAACR